MCLTINGLHYNAFEDKYIPMTAEFDLEVSKALTGVKHYKYVNGCQIEFEIYETPFQFVQVKFKNGQLLQKASGNGAHLGKRKSWEVNQGIHSVTCRTRYEFSNNHFIKWHYAVIPKGTNFFIGDFDDVVSERLLVFETKEYYEEYCKNNNVKKDWFDHKKKKVKL